MNQITRVDQAVLLLKERLRKLSERKGIEARDAAAAARTGNESRLTPIRQLARQGQIAPRDLRRALVKSLLADSLGEDLATSLEFQALSDRVTQLLEDSEQGQNLLDRALTELG